MAITVRAVDLYVQFFSSHAKWLDTGVSSSRVEFLLEEQGKEWDHPGRMERGRASQEVERSKTDDPWNTDHPRWPMWGGEMAEGGSGN